MRGSRWNRLLIGVAAVAVLALGALPSEASSPYENHLVGSIGSYFVGIDRDTGDAEEIGTIFDTYNCRGMSFHADRGELFCIFQDDNGPNLATIDVTTGMPLVIGPLYTLTSDLARAEAMAYNELDGQLYAFVGTGSRSNTLAIINPDSGLATPLVGLSGTIENEADSMEFVNGVLYIVDIGLPVHMYTVNMQTGQATFHRSIPYNGCRDMAWDTETQYIYCGSEGPIRTLVRIPVDPSASTEVVGVTHAEDEFDNPWEVVGIATVPRALELSLDIKPGSCPNPVNTRSRGVLPAAILGDWEFDVTAIDLASIRLAGVQPLRSSYADVGTPYDLAAEFTSCTEDCHELGPDGEIDLTLKFSKRDIVAALGEVTDGQCLVLTLTGRLKPEFGGLEFSASDVVLMIHR